ncbi:hypothetical protein P170DRAFT_287005 [Aspergillus steynii IBT 23096]|uniref:Uncharacterized protein n=1 Tax=Aspergillus steynii IBT 23096 TaxID=1392250 RepID=A0A2I2FV14_9EURO|nr:uncharacterized protein P170DRAFT_287005 [Aspergillus steynii IBT 23096]PLB44462.1 hypothetical protein P170DRAFT_287005 [Aspergillus steynii IBT 23096]
MIVCPRCGEFIHPSTNSVTDRCYALETEWRRHQSARSSSQIPPAKNPPPNQALQSMFTRPVDGVLPPVAREPASPSTVNSFPWSHPNNELFPGLPLARRALIGAWIPIPLSASIGEDRQDHDEGHESFTECDCGSRFLRVFASYQGGIIQVGLPRWSCRVLTSWLCFSSVGTRVGWCLFISIFLRSFFLLSSAPPFSVLAIVDFSYVDSFSLSLLLGFICFCFFSFLFLLFDLVRSLFSTSPNGLPQRPNPPGVMVVVAVVEVDTSANLDREQKYQMPPGPIHEAMERIPPRVRTKKYYSHPTPEGELPLDLALGLPSFPLALSGRKHQADLDSAGPGGFHLSLTEY